MAASFLRRKILTQFQHKPVFLALPLLVVALWSLILLIYIHKHDTYTYLNAEDIHINKWKSPKGFVLPETLIKSIQMNLQLSQTSKELGNSSRKKYLADKEMNNWYSRRETYCNEQLQIYDQNFVRILNVLIDMSKATGKRGGEEIKDVINQEEKKEYCTLNPGFFRLKCSEKVINPFPLGNHLSKWLDASEMVPALPNADHTISEFTIAITRYEYANFYHTMTDFYNAFLVMKFFNHSPTETNILFIDGHPKGALDTVWQTLFNSSKYLGRVRQNVIYKDLVWGIQGYSSPMYIHKRQYIPFIEEFSHFFLNRYDINNKKNLKCENLTISFIWRRDYLAHPRNPTGFVTRKIKNEKELLATAHEMYPSFTIQDSQLDLLPMRQQLQYVSNSDILIGMHGAGLTHVLFLPKHAGLIELYPSYWSTNNVHFQKLSKWRGSRHIFWQNEDLANELSHKYTQIPVHIFKGLLKVMVDVLCPT